MNFNQEQLVKSPLNYTGNKFKLLPQILPLIPDDINNFYDIFGGSFTVGANIKANKIIYNEYNKFVFELVHYLSTCNINEELQAIDDIIKINKLGDNTKEEYYYFRDEIYNKNQNPRMLFVLACYSLNCQLRFNSKGKFNMTCGNRHFNDNIRNRFIEFNKAIKNKNVEFHNKSFIDFDSFQEGDFVYLDPPYLPTITSYTENGGWTPQKEEQLYNYIDNLNEKGVKFALSNVSIYRNEENKMLNGWSKKYIINNLNYKYKNNNCYRKDNSTTTQEVLITNYIINK